MYLTVILNVVSNEQLFVSRFVSLIFTLVCLCALIINIYKIVKIINLKELFLRLILIIAFTIGLFFGSKRVIIDHYLLKYGKFTLCKTISFSNKFPFGECIIYEYEINGKKYKNCESYFPVNKDSIKVPNGTYYVRYSEKFPEKGRIVLKNK